MSQTVIIVDDEADTRDMISAALSMDGWSVETTDSLLGALQIVRRIPDAHCMLLDYNLPGMSMWDFLKQLSSIAPDIRIVLMTAADRVADKAKLFKIQRYLPKPIDIDALRAAVAH